MEEELRSQRDATAEQVVEELKKVAFASFGDVSEIVDAAHWLDGIPPEQLAAVASIRVKPVSNGLARDVKMYDKLKALEMLAKIHGMFDGGTGDADALPVIVNDIPKEGGE